MTLRPSVIPAPNRRRGWAYALPAALFALAQLRLMVLLLPKAFVLSAQVSEGVYKGEPLWRVYQSRALGPYLLHALGGLVGGLPGGFALFTFLVLFTTGFLALALTERLDDPQRAPLWTFFLTHLLFVFLLPGIWIYPWDLLSLLFFTIFNYLALKRAHLAAFIALFAVAVLNHEVALGIAAWLILDPLIRWGIARRSSAVARLDWTTLLTGLGLFAGGVVVIETLRRTLLVREVLPPSILPGHIVYGRSFHFSLLQNWDSILKSFTWEVPAGFPFLVTLFLAAILVFAIRLGTIDRMRYGALAAVLVALTASLLLFGLVFETRVLMPLVPFVALNAGAVFGRRSVPRSGAAEAVPAPRREPGTAPRRKRGVVSPP